MGVTEFLDDPVKNHPVYLKSAFLAVAPEYSTGEILLGSAYRKLLLDITDADVDLEKIPDLPHLIPQEFGGEEVWNTLLLNQGAIASPSRGRQSILYQLMPLVPEIARNACVLGKKRNRWYPANLLLQAIGNGIGKDAGELLIKRFGDALQVSQDDDIFARFVQNALQAAEPLPNTNFPYLISLLDESDVFGSRGSFGSVSGLSPSERFCKDLGAVIDLKQQLTRRQWTVLVEAALRLGLGMHILWICHINSICWQMVLSAANGTNLTIDEIEHSLWQSHRDTSPLLEVGGNAVRLVEQSIERYVYGRFGLNLVLHKFDEAGCSWPNGQIIGTSSTSGNTAPVAIANFLKHVVNNRLAIDQADPAGWLRSKCAEVVEKRLALVKADSGFTKNMLEFLRHSLGQIDTRDPEKVSYDQAYLFSGKGKGNRLIVQPGPAMLIFLVYACCRDQGGIPSSLEDFRMHLADYGLHAPAGELVGGRVGSDLEKLGLVVDSPDAAGGRLLVPPFKSY